MVMEVVFMERPHTATYNNRMLELPKTKDYLVQCLWSAFTEYANSRKGIESFFPNIMWS